MVYRLNKSKRTHFLGLVSTIPVNTCFKKSTTISASRRKSIPMMKSSDSNGIHRVSTKIAFSPRLIGVIDVCRMISICLFVTRTFLPDSFTGFILDDLSNQMLLFLAKVCVAPESIKALSVRPQIPFCR